MVRLLAVFLLLGLLPACAGVHDWSSVFRNSIQADKFAAVQYNFDWELSGHRAVAPVQVFDDGRRTWLQFSPQQAVPAIFTGVDGGGRPLAYAREGPYVVLQGVWPVLVLRGGRLKSTIRRLKDGEAGQHDAGVEQRVSGADAQALAPAAGVSVAVDAAASDAVVRAANTPALIPIAASVADAGQALSSDPAQTEVRVDSTAGEEGAAFAGRAQAQLQSVLAKPSSSLASALTAASFDLSVSRPVERFHVSPQDINLRSALARWARQADWTFELEHWAVDADIPIMGTASFELDFKLAVRELVASSELGDRPVQPCFYSNRVLRVVPYAQPCDRTAGATRPS